MTGRSNVVTLLDSVPGKSSSTELTDRRALELPYLVGVILIGSNLDDHMRIAPKDVNDNAVNLDERGVVELGRRVVRAGYGRQRD